MWASCWRPAPFHIYGKANQRNVRWRLFFPLYAACGSHAARLRVNDGNLLVSGSELFTVQNPLLLRPSFDATNWSFFAYDWRTGSWKSDSGRTNKWRTTDWSEKVKFFVEQCGAMLESTLSFWHTTGLVSFESIEISVAKLLLEQHTSIQYSTF